MIRFENFSFNYEGSSFGVHHIDLHVKKGELIVLTGPSGCGKTTLTRCMNGLIPDFYEGAIHGHCKVCEMDITEHETGDFAAKVGSVFQDPRSQFFTMKVRTEIPFPGENLGISQKILQQNMDKTISELSLEPLMEHSIFALSSGEKQKIAAASVYAADVEIYVLDEPSANLDRDGTEQLRQLLSQLKAQGKTIVVSEHKLYYLRELADRVVCMKDGNIRKIYTGKEFAALPEEERMSHGLRQTDLSKITGKAPCIQISDSQISDNGICLEAENLSFYYSGEKTLWKDASFTCKSGEIIGIVGKNGAGKTTLSRVLMGLEKPSTGKIRLEGKNASKRQRRKESFSVIQDVDYQLIAGSVWEELLQGHENEPDAQEHIDRLLKDFSLEPYKETHPSAMSGGQKQRLSIALACMSGKRIIFFDEPTSGLDAANMQLVRKIMIRQAQSGCLCFVITHDYEFAAQLFTSILTIEKDGRIRQISQKEYHPEKLYEYYQEK